MILETPTDVFEPGNLKSDDVEYDCIMLDDESLDKVKRLVEGSSLFDELANANVSVPESLSMQKGMHCTLNYFGSKPDSPKRAVQLTNSELGVDVDLVILGVGAYAKDGQLMNIGLLVDKDSSAVNPALSAKRDTLFGNKYSHVTVAINKAAKAKAVDTAKCFDEDVVFGENEFACYVAVNEPIVLKGKTMAVQHGIQATQLSDEPTKSVAKSYYYLSIVEYHDYDDEGHDMLLDCSVNLGKCDEEDSEFHDNEQGSYSSVQTYDTIDEVKKVLENCSCARNYSIEITNDVDSSDKKYLSDAGLVPSKLPRKDDSSSRETVDGDTIQTDSQDSKGVEI